MIITRIGAGMGNQMFMYAAGLSLSQRLNTELKLDIYNFNKESFRKYSLVQDIYALAPFMAVADYFHIRGNSIFKHPFRRLLYEFMSRTGLLELGRAAHKQRKPGSILAPIPCSRVYFPPDFSYSENFNQIQDNTYITGFWESEKFFADIASDVRKKFTFPPECFTPELSHKIKTCSSTAVHVRLGDKANAGSEYIRMIAYYLKHAFYKLEELTDGLRYFVFSDDINWCRKNLTNIH